MIRELVDGVLLPQQICDSCSVEVSLCFGNTAIDVCCNCDETCSTNYNTYLVKNNNSFSVTIYVYGADGVLISQELAANDSAYFCSIGTPFSDSLNIEYIFSICEC